MSAQPSSLRAVAVCGAAASGKTSVGHSLALALGWPLRDLDEVAPPSPAQVAPASGSLVDRERGDAVPTRSEADARRYVALLTEARRILAHPDQVGFPATSRPGVVIVAPFTVERMLPHAWETAIKSLGITQSEAVLVWVDTPASVTAERMRSRAADRDAARILAEQSAEQSAQPSPPPHGIPCTPHLRSDGLLPVASQVTLLIEAMRDR